jgi:hypothetical protein
MNKGQIEPCMAENCIIRESCLRYALSHAAKKTDKVLHRFILVTMKNECSNFITSKTI